jgi:hypothetical protein
MVAGPTVTAFTDGPLATTTPRWLAVSVRDGSSLAAHPTVKIPTHLTHPPALMTFPPDHANSNLGAKIRAH